LTFSSSSCTWLGCRDRGFIGGTGFASFKSTSFEELTGRDLGLAVGVRLKIFSSLKPVQADRDLVQLRTSISRVTPLRPVSVAERTKLFESKDDAEETVSNNSPNVTDKILDSVFFFVKFVLVQILILYCFCCFLHFETHLKLILVESSLD
jgi:hypothetical protein